MAKQSYIQNEVLYTGTEGTEVEIDVHVFVGGDDRF